MHSLSIASIMDNAGSGVVFPAHIINVLSCGGDHQPWQLRRSTSPIETTLARLSQDHCFYWIESPISEIRR